MAIIPIWKDTFYTYLGSSVQYTINESGGTTLFSGIAYAYPGSNSCSINVNRICENYLQQTFPYTTGGSVSEQSEAAKTFELYDIYHTKLTDFRFYYNWGYEDITGTTLSRPVNQHVVKGMHLYNTEISGDNITTTETIVSGETDYCGDYALYYLNRYGGWDSFLIEGKVVEKDEFEVSTYERYRNNNDKLSRENNRYRNEINHSWELNTSWLSDDESKILAKHLFSSNQVFLHNLNTNEIFPVDITDSSIEYKSFKNERKMIYHTINVKESNKRLVC